MEISKPLKPTYFIAYDSNDVRHVGKTEVDQVTTTGQPFMIFSDDPNAFLDSVNSESLGDFNPLPLEGEEVTAGTVYTYNGAAVIARQSHIRTIYEPSDTPSLFSVHRPDTVGMEWIANESVTLSEERSFEGKTYKVIQAHTTQEDWTPPAVPALWQEVIIIIGIPAWVQPTGGHDAYNIGDQVSFEGNNYESLINANVWSPTVYPAGWKLI